MALLWLLAAPACSPRYHTDSATDIETVMERQVAAWNRGDIEGFLQGYWQSPDLLFASRGRFSRGWTALLERYREGYPEGRMGTLRFDDVEIHMLGRHWAWVAGKWSLKQESGSPHGAFTLIWHRTANGWRIVHDHSSGVPQESTDEPQE